MDRTAYKNRHIKEHYDRINFVIPKGEKDRIKKICSEIGAGVNDMTGSRNIHCMKTSEVRRIIGKTRKR